MQAAAEHGHWAREHRRAAWMGALAESMEGLNSLHSMESSLERGVVPANDGVERLSQAVEALARATVELSVWGPDDGADACADLQRDLNRQFAALTDWMVAVRAGQDPTHLQQAYAAANTTRRESYAKLLELARSALRDNATP